MVIVVSQNQYKISRAKKKVSNGLLKGCFNGLQFTIALLAVSSFCFSGSLVGRPWSRCPHSLTSPVLTSPHEYWLAWWGLLRTFGTIFVFRNASTGVPSCSLHHNCVRSVGNVCDVLRSPSLGEHLYGVFERYRPVRDDCVHTTLDGLCSAIRLLLSPGRHARLTHRLSECFLL